MYSLGRRSKDTISIQIETNSIKFVLGKYNNDALIVHKLLSVDLEPNVYENGMPNDRLALKNAIDSGIKQLNTHAKNVVLSIESSEILKREIQIPKVEESDLKDLVRFEVSQYLPIEVNDYVLQYQVLSTELEDENEKLNVLIVAMPNTMAEYYFELLSELKLNPIGMDLAGNNAVKLVKFGMEEVLVNQTVAILDIAYANIEVTILDGGLNKLNRLLSMGTQQIKLNVSQKLDLPYEQTHQLVMSYLDIGIYDLIEANAAFERLSMNGEMDIDGLTMGDFNKNASKKMLAVAELTDHIKEVYDEVEKVFKYYTFKERGNKIDQIRVYGDFAKIPDLTSIIEERLNIKTELLDANKLNYVTIRSNTANVNSYVGAIGGLIRPKGDK